MMHDAPVPAMPGRGLSSFCGYAVAVLPSSQEQPSHQQADCEQKRIACEERSARWLQTCMFCDEQLRFLLAYIDYHRTRSERREYVERIRKRIAWMLTQMK
jgi:hypothetical protein